MRFSHADYLTGPKPVKTSLQTSANLHPGTAASVAYLRLVRLCEIRAGFAGRGDVLGAGALQDILRAFNPIRVVAVDGGQDLTLLDHAFIALGLVFGDAHSYECADDPADHPTGSGACQRTHDGSGCDEGSETW